MVKVFNKATNELLGRINETDLAFLQSHLEKEGPNDTDFYMRRETIEEFATNGGSEHLLTVLKGGLRNDDALEIRWERD